MRERNAIDFWRGFALITIFINHVPENFYARYTYSQVSISDAAELFVFLAGWSIALATEGRHGPEPAGRMVIRLASRAVEVYRAQVVITAVALAMIAAAALGLDNPLFLEWHNAGPVFADPVRATPGWVLLTHQLGFFNILPLYVVLLAIAPAFILVARLSRALALVLSAALWLASLVLGLNLPSWPGEGDWFFDPLAWQLLLVVGYLAFGWNRGEALSRWAGRLVPLGVLGVGVGAVVAGFDLWPDPFSVPEPRALFTNDKTYVSPMRLAHFVALVIAFHRLYPAVARRLPWAAEQFSGLGRNSLAVFSVGSIASLAAQFVRYVYGGGFFIDTLVISSGIACLFFTAWFVEWRSRSPRRSSPS